MSAKTTHVLVPKGVVTRKLPLNLHDEDVDLFQDDLTQVLPETHLLEFTDVRITPEGILLKGYHVLPESFAFSTNFDQWKLRSRIKLLVSSNLLRRRRSFKREVLWIINDWSTGYFHWLSDALSKLYVMRERLDQLVLMLPHTYAGLNFVPSSLSCFTSVVPEFIGPNEVVCCTKLLMPSETAPPGHHNEEIIRGLRDLICSKYGDANYDGPGERIYISRSRASKRRIMNEDEILPVLNAYRFETLYAEDLSFAEQVRIFSRARSIVSNHGAGLMNILFAPENSNILELRQAGDRIRNYYFGLSSALNQNYFYQTCQPADAETDPHLADLIIDPVSLETNLQLMV